MRMRNVIFAGMILGALTVRSARADDDTAKLFKSQCASCHGQDGKGQTTPGRAAGVKDWTDGKTLSPLTDADLEKRSGRERWGTTTARP